MDVNMLWRALGQSVLYKDPAATLQRYLGALHKFGAFDRQKPDAFRSMLTSMDDYAVNAIQPSRPSAARSSP